MGNIAVTARDVARFYHLLGSGKLVSDSSLAQMKDFKPLTTGFAKGSALILWQAAAEACAIGWSGGGRHPHSG